MLLFFIALLGFIKISTSIDLTGCDIFTPAFFTPMQETFDGIHYKTKYNGKFSLLNLGATVCFTFYPNKAGLMTNKYDFVKITATRARYIYPLTYKYRTMTVNDSPDNYQQVDKTPGFHERLCTDVKGKGDDHKKIAESITADPGIPWENGRDTFYWNDDDYHYPGESICFTTESWHGGYSWNQGRKWTGVCKLCSPNSRSHGVSWVARPNKWYQVFGVRESNQQNNYDFIVDITIEIFSAEQQTRLTKTIQLNPYVSTLNTPILENMIGSYYFYSQGIGKDLGPSISNQGFVGELGNLASTGFFVPPENIDLEMDYVTNDNFKQYSTLNCVADKKACYKIGAIKCDAKAPNEGYCRYSCKCVQYFTGDKTNTDKISNVRQSGVRLFGHYVLDGLIDDANNNNRTIKNSKFTIVTPTTLQNMPYYRQDQSKVDRFGQYPLQETVQSFADFEFFMSGTYEIIVDENKFSPSHCRFVSISGPSCFNCDKPTIIKIEATALGSKGAFDVSLFDLNENYLNTYDLVTSSVFLETKPTQAEILVYVPSSESSFYIRLSTLYGYCLINATFSSTLIDRFDPGNFGRQPLPITNPPSDGPCDWWCEIKNLLGDVLSWILANFTIIVILFLLWLCFPTIKSLFFS